MCYDPDLGFVVLRQVFTPAEIDAVLERCDTIRNGPESDLMPGDKLHGGTVHLERLAQRIDQVQTLVANPKVANAVRSIVGQRHNLVQSSLRSPRPGFGQQQLHTDDAPKEHRGPCRVATAIVALVPFTKLNGATRIVPGSHSRIDLQRNPGNVNHSPEKLQEQIMVTDAGSMILFSGHLIHSGRKNNSTHERPALQLIWHRQG